MNVNSIGQSVFSRVGNLNSTVKSNPFRNTQCDSVSFTCKKCDKQLPMKQVIKMAQVLQDGYENQKFVPVSALSAICGMSVDKVLQAVNSNELLNAYWMHNLNVLNDCVYDDYSRNCDLVDGAFKYCEDAKCEVKIGTLEKLTGIDEEELYEMISNNADMMTKAFDYLDM